jgi:hypothetical protein
LLRSKQSSLAGLFPPRYVVFFPLTSVSDSGDDERSDGDREYDLNDSFINDGDYTQAPDGVETGMAMYHNLHRSLLPFSPHCSS